MMKRSTTSQDLCVLAFWIGCFGLMPAFAQEATESGADANTVAPNTVQQTAADAESTVIESASSDDDVAPNPEQADKPSSQETDTQAGFDCESAPWVLGEAGRARGATVTFNPNWQARLQNIVACKSLMIKRARCLRLQGHYDSHIFSRDVVHVFGTQQAAQTTRARSRAQTVAAHLESLEFPESLLTIRPPPTESSFRGVLVDYEEDCFGAKQYVEAKASEETDVVEVVTVIEDVESAVEPSTKPVLTPKKMVRDLWTQLDAGAFYLDDREGVTGLQTALHLGWTYRGLYIKVLGTMSGTDEELHRAGYGGQAGFGVHTPWTDLGIVAGIRNNARGLSDPVGDQIQFVGVDAQQCVWRQSGFAFCVREAFAPLTRLERKLDLDNGQLVRINSVTTQPMQFELAASIRYYFGESQ